jgi:triacylglycerol lipase
LITLLALGEPIPAIASVRGFFPGGDGDGKGFEALTTESMKKFNEITPDVEGVTYFSWGASASPGILELCR